MALVVSGSGCDRSYTPDQPEVGPGGVRLGMSRHEVVQVMLDDVPLLQMSGKVMNPYAARYVEDIDGETLEIMYYYTGMKKGDNLVSEDELVPIILKGNAVIGWGWETLEEMVGGRPFSGM